MEKRWGLLLKSWFGDKSPAGLKKASFYGALSSFLVGLYYIGFSYWVFQYPEPIPSYLEKLVPPQSYQWMMGATGILCVLAAFYSGWAIYYRRNFFEIFGMYFWIAFEVIGCVFGGYWKSLPFFIILFPLILNCYHVFRTRPIRSLKDLQLSLLEDRTEFQ